MAPKKSTIVLNVEQFIHDIEERPAIWNRNFHCNKAFLEQMWDELSGTHKLPSKYSPFPPPTPAGPMVFVTVEVKRDENIASERGNISSVCALITYNAHLSLSHSARF